MIPVSVDSYYPPQLGENRALMPQKQAMEQREVIKAVKALNQSEFFGSSSEVTFGVDRETRRPVIRIVDRVTKEVVTQIPPEYVLRLAQDSSSKESQYQYLG